jgi:transposase-like protein
MKCKKCGSLARKMGKRPEVGRNNKIRRYQAYQCKKCHYQWREK